MKILSAATEPAVTLSSVTLHIRTMNSHYALQIGRSRSTLICLSGTFAGQQWNASPSIGPAVLNYSDFPLVTAWKKATELDFTEANEQLRGLIGRPVMFSLLGEESPSLHTSNVTAVEWRP